MKRKGERLRKPDTDRVLWRVTCDVTLICAKLCSQAISNVKCNSCNCWYRLFCLISFRPGSIVAEFKLLFEQKFSEDKALAPLKKAVANGKLGSLAVDPKSLKILKEEEGNLQTIFDRNSNNGNSNNSSVTEAEVGPVAIATVLLRVGVEATVNSSSTWRFSTTGRRNTLNSNLRYFAFTLIHGKGFRCKPRGRTIRQLATVFNVILATYVTSLVSSGMDLCRSLEFTSYVERGLLNIQQLIPHITAPSLRTPLKSTLQRHRKVSAQRGEWPLPVISLSGW